MLVIGPLVLGMLGLERPEFTTGVVAEGPRGGTGGVPP